MSSGRWRLLSVVMAAGALFDLAFAVAILAAPAASAALLAIDLPADPVHLRLNGVLLLLLAALYALPALRPERFHVIAPISAGGRALGGVVLVSAGRSGSTYPLLGWADLALGTVTALAWVAARRTSPSD